MHRTGRDGGLHPDQLQGKDKHAGHDLAEAKKGDPKYEIFENHDMKARLHGDSAVVTGVTHTKGISGGQPFDAEFRFTDTFVKDHGRWRLGRPGDEDHALKQGVDHSLLRANDLNPDR